ncbi:phage tail tube protein [Streptomyces sp. H10-C2]|uniref:phage tail tube protein n=1 Tax=unclassified Streptomyces TaxID=2593676 RepID=UPI0024BA715A|nr:MULTISPECIES: phage tail tube protein [unclassified Streptomyces]MDJ0342293.1 phage tail tube protein [Streptomyces sp. PH10-H1]MDJ0368807.1 phage tail tube protein [Streptomyces sp. H10-C2]
MTQISRLAAIGLAKESVAGTWLAPTVGIPFLKGDYEDMIGEIKDESVRGNDTVLQGMYAGPIHAEWQLDVLAYPDLAGHFLAGMIGPDTVTAATATTLSALTIVGATSISTAVALPAGSVIRIDTAGLVEYAWTDGVATGAGPYVSNVTTVLGKIGASRVGLTLGHASGVAVTTTTTHTFKQSTTALPTYSLTLFDTTQTVSCSYCRLSDLQLKIDPKGAVSLAVKYVSFPSVVQSLQTQTFSTFDPVLGWSWNMTNGGAASTRGLSYDATIKRATEAINSSDGTQAPREVFAGPIEVDGTYKAIFENQLDMNLYLNYTQTAATATLQQPVARGGQSLSLTMSKSGWFKGKRDLSSAYVQGDFSLSGIYNTTDGGAVQAVLQNFQTAAY